MRKIENLMNRLSDLGGPFWPMPAADLKKNRPITATMLLSYTPVFGTLIASSPILTYIVAMENTVPPGWLAATFGLSMLVFFIGYRYTFGLCWNLRAERLRASEENGLLNIDGFGVRGGPAPRNTPTPFTRRGGAPDKSAA